MKKALVLLACCLGAALCGCRALPGGGSAAGTASSAAASSGAVSSSRAAAGSSSAAGAASSGAAGSSSASAAGASSASSGADAGTKSAAGRRLAALSLEEKVGQLFFIRPDALDPALTDEQISDPTRYGVTACSPEMAKALKTYPVGGVVFFGKNLTSPAQLAKMEQGLRAASGLPLILGVDEEGGRVARLAKAPGFSLPTYESMAAVGKTGDPEQARQVGVTIGGYLKQYGFDLDFAPVADVNTNPANPVIGDRSFGSDPALAAKMVAAEIRGLHSAGIMSCAKHFPGHGDTKGDTHEGTVTLDKSWDELKACELIPFEAARDAGSDFVMAAHITVPRVTDDGLPASLSRRMLTEKLRGELGYTGLIVTDSLAMGAVTARYSPAEAAVLALEAGADVLLMPEDLGGAFAGMVAAVQSGEVSEERLDESVLRILTLKEQYGLLTA